MDGIFYLNTEFYQIKTYKLKFGFHKIRRTLSSSTTMDGWMDE